MACELTTGRALDCRDTVGGVKAIYLAQHDSVNIGGGAGASIEPSSGEVNDVDLTGSGTGSQLFKYNLVRGTGSFTETITGSTENGTIFYDQSINIKLHKLSLVDRNEIKLLARNRLVIFVELNQIRSTGKRLIMVCGLDNGMELNTGTGASGVAFGDMSGYDLTFTSQESFPAATLADYDDNPFDNTAFTVSLDVS